MNRDSVATGGRFLDRSDAGRALAQRLIEYKDSGGVILGMARGGVEVGAAVAEQLDLALVPLVIRKIGAPHNPEFAIGAVSETGENIIDNGTARALGISDRYLESEIAKQEAEAARRRKQYSGGPGLDVVQGRAAIVVDDGIATGASALVAVRSARHLGATSVVLATPVASPRAAEVLASEVDRLVVLHAPDAFEAVGSFYERFDQVTDEQVVELLRRVDALPGSREPASSCGVSIAVDGAVLGGILTVPSMARGIVLFAHGSGSGRRSPRNQAVASHLNRAGLATLLVDLLLENEAKDRALVFDIDLLAARLTAIQDWLARHDATAHLPLGLFGASTGGGAALVAAARNPERVRAVVSRGGLADLAGDALQYVRTPALLIVGGNDEQVLALNQTAMIKMEAEVELRIVPGAGHLFEGPHALDEVARLAVAWFERFLG